MTNPTNADRQPLAHRRLEQLAETWNYVKSRSLFYADLLPDIDAGSLGMTALRQVPVLTQQDFAKHKHRIRTRNGLPDYFLFSGGSTGVPRIIFGSGATLEKRVKDPARDGGPIPITLTTGGGHHGELPRSVRVPSTLEFPLRTAEDYAWMWRVLIGAFRFEGYLPMIHHAVLPLPAVKKFVSYILENNLDGALLDLMLVETHSWHLSQGWRQLIENVLGAFVRHHYGFTEILTTAAQCLTCGWFHYGEDVIWEVLDIDTDEPLKDGIGRLLVTSLYPHHDDHVLLRYAPGDVVCLGPWCPAADDRAFRPLGRLSSCISCRFKERRTWLLLPAQVQELLDTSPWIARLENRRFGRITSSGDDEFPKWTATLTQGDPPILQIELELKFDPGLFSTYWNSIKTDFTSKLVRMNADLRGAVDTGRVALSVVGRPPGAISADRTVIC